MTKTTPHTPGDQGKKKPILPVIGIVAAVVAAYFIVKNYRYEGTDDAYIQAHTLMLAPRIGGTVEKVMVNENDKVKAGQLLAQLDDQDYSTAYSQSVADQASVQADLEQAAQDYQRIAKLYQEEAVPKQQLDAAVARYHNLASRLKADEAKADQAKINLTYTLITAPEDGTIAKKSVEPGMVVPPGQALFGFVSSQETVGDCQFQGNPDCPYQAGAKSERGRGRSLGQEFRGSGRQYWFRHRIDLHASAPGQFHRQLHQGGSTRARENQPGKSLGRGYRPLGGGFVRNRERKDTLKDCA